MESNCDESSVHDLLVSHFYDGCKSYHDGKSETDMPGELFDEGKHYWLSGFRSAARSANNPPISANEYNKVADAAHCAGREDRKKGIIRPNPFCPEEDSERNDIWAAVYSDGMGISGYENFEVLGIPRQVVRVK